MGKPDNKQQERKAQEIGNRLMSLGKAFVTEAKGFNSSLGINRQPGEHRRFDHHRSHMMVERLDEMLRELEALVKIGDALKAEPPQD